MRTVLYAAAIIAAMTTAAHAESWIIVTTRADAQADGKMIPALVAPDLYKNSSQCMYHKGRIEGILMTQYPNSQYNLWCAQVPGLVATQ